MDNDQDLGDFRSVLYSVDREGRRRWQYVHVIAGAWRRRRQLLAWFLIVAYVALPFLMIGGDRVVHIDIPKRQYTILGHVFWPQDAIFLILLTLMGIVATLLMVSVLGRVFCGWLCPHNAYLEFVFRPIETLFEGKAPRRRRQDKGPLTPGLALRKGLKYAVYLAIAWGLANTFIALFLPSAAHWNDFLGHVLIDPSLHPTAFTTWLIALALILFNFAWFREQTCTIVCPYGRLQAVMLDSDSLSVAYDAERGEPRGKKTARDKGRAREGRLPKGSDNSDVTSQSPQDQSPSREKGDCLDCGACQAVCPTGIDIRNGNQMECIHCAACIDACNAIMLRAGRAPNLIGYSSENALAGGRFRFLRLRGLLYAVVLAGLLTVTLSMILTREPVLAQSLRERDHASLATDGEGRKVVRKQTRLALVNRTGRDIDIDLALAEGIDGRLITQFPHFTLPAAERLEVPIFIEVPPAAFSRPRIEPRIEVRYQGAVREQVPILLRQPPGLHDG